jgi:fluoride ion exporter CrcB/FEX
MGDLPKVAGVLLAAVIGCLVIAILIELPKRVRETEAKLAECRLHCGALK